MLILYIDCNLALIYVTVNESLLHRLNKLKVTERMLQLLASQYLMCAHTVLLFHKQQFKANSATENSAYTKDRAIDTIKRHHLSVPFLKRSNVLQYTCVAEQ